VNANTNLFTWKFGDRILAFPSTLEADLPMLMKNLYIRKAGIAIGKPAVKELIPDHELALSNAVNGNLVAISLKKEDALQYLRKEEVRIDDNRRGWALVRYEGLNLGWVKVLPNRINNYYPKEWRILKSANN
jgi:NOL1/NOP2/fmu family ribosome biogenesis protein